MSVRLLPQVECNAYYTDGQRLMRVISLSDLEALLEDAATLKVEGMAIRDLMRKWRRVARASG